MKEEVKTLLIQEPVTWQELQKLLIEATLIRNQGNRMKSAREMDISIRSLRLKLHKFEIGLRREDFKNEKEA